jgi:hypothetical protein
MMQPSYSPSSVLIARRCADASPQAYADGAAMSVLAAPEMLRGTRETVSGCPMSKDGGAIFLYPARETPWLTFACCGDLSHIRATELEPLTVLNHRQ